MPGNRHLAFLSFAVILLALAPSLSSLSAGDQKLSPEELVAEHLKSIAASGTWEQIKNRVILGTFSVQILQGAFGQPLCQAQIASEGRKLAIAMTCDNQQYPGEYFAFDGNSVTVGRYIRGTLSPLGEFINRFDGLIKEGLLGGTLSLGWSLGNIAQKRPRLKYNQAKLDGRSVHELEYRPRKGLGDFKITLYFEPETYRHIRSEYRLHIFDAIGTTDTHYILSEAFSDFKEVDGMVLPHQYMISFSAEGRRSTFLAHWIFNAKAWSHNGQIDLSIFRAPE